MADYRQNQDRPASFWETAVDGLFPGLAGGVAMLAVLLASGMLDGKSPVQIMAAFDTLSGDPLRGALMHLAVSCVYGALFALFTWKVANRMRGWSIVFLGAFYGLALWLVAMNLLTEQIFALMMENHPLAFFLSHLTYGGTLGLFLARQRAGSWSSIRRAGPEESMKIL